MQKQKIYVYITCHGHSGSTLLELLLGSHSTALAVGEVKHFSDYYLKKSERCGCNSALSQCAFWKEVLKVMKIPDESIQGGFPTESIRGGFLENVFYNFVLATSKSLFKKFSKLSNNLFAKNAQRLVNHWQLISTASEVSNSQVIIDASMSASRMLELLFTCPDNFLFKVIYLTRDGRGNANSYRKNFGLTITEASRRWKKTNSNIQLALKNLRSSEIMQIAYEALCQQPENTLNHICQFIGIDYEGNMLKFRDKTQHGIGGNPMRFRTTETTIHLDEKWKKELNNNELVIFNKIAGNVNKKLGYS